MTITVLVSSEDGVAALSDVDNVWPVYYPQQGPLPDEARQARVLVPTTSSRERFLPSVAELPALEYVQLLSAGAERWLGRLPAQVKVSTCRGAHGGSTAEWVVGAVLSLLRDFAYYEHNRERRRWDRHLTDTLQDKRVLVIGAGDLGAELDRRLVTFDSTVTLVGRTARDGVAGLAELPDLLGGHDIVVLVVPLTAETTRMVDKDFLARMPDGAILVNAARGPVVDTDALVAELQAGRLMAALDVTDPEPLPEDHPLWSVPGLFLTPHVGGFARGLDERAWKVAAAEIARFAAGEQPKNLVRGEY